MNTSVPVLPASRLPAGFSAPRRSRFGPLGPWAAGFLALVASLLGAGALSAAPTTFGTALKQIRVPGGGAETELFSYSGQGALTHLWFGGAFTNYGLMRVRVYVDGETTASINMQLMLGHGIGFQDNAAPWGTARIGKTGSPSGIYDTYRIPFGTAVRVTVQPDPSSGTNLTLWSIIRGSTGLPVTVGGITLPATARLHLRTHEDLVVAPLQTFTLYATNRSGMLYQVTMAAQSSNFDFASGEFRVAYGGSSTTQVFSSGTGDYFLGTYAFNRGVYYTPVAGCTHLNASAHEFSAYRFHEDDLVSFQNGFVLTCQCGSPGDGSPQTTTYTTYVWTYEW